MKKSLLSLLLLLLSMVASAHDFEVDGIYYNIINGNEVAVTYKGSDPFGNGEKYTGHVNIPSFVTYNSTIYSVTSIGDYAFRLCNGLTSIMIPNSVTSIGDYAFKSSNGLTSIMIPNSVTSIGRGAFEDCRGLTDMVIPNSVTSIGKYALSYCWELASIHVESGNAIYDSRDNCNAIIETSSNTLIAGCKNTIIPNSVTNISSYAFDGCYGLTSIVIAKTVTSIGDGAFSGCIGLTSIHVESGNDIYDSRDNCNAIIKTSSNTLIAGCKNTIIPNSVTNISSYAFDGCYGLTSIIIPNSVTSIGSGAFSDCRGLTDIVIPNSVTSIGSGAFYCCYGLTSIEIGNSVTSIGYQALNYCSNLTDIYSYSQYPPTCFAGTFDSYTATLHVPAASLAAYFTAPCWENFENIVGDAVAPEGISISKDSVNLQLDEQLRLVATVTPDNASNKEITWISTDTTVATVNDGMVLAVGYGECDIIASCFGMRAICHVLVANIITLDQQEAMLLPNHLLTLTPSAPTTPDSYTVSSSDPTVAAARVLSSGKIQVVGIKEGTTTITVGSVDGTAIPATCLVTVYTETGDMNSDGFINISDVTSLINYLLSGEDSQISTKNADVNGDNKIGISDVTALINKLLRGTE